MSQNIGLKKEDIKAISENLSKLLANEYFLYLKTLNIHWNVTGSNFFGFHKLLEDQYNWLKDNIDEIAERIRTLGVLAPANYKKYSQDSIISEGDNTDDFEGMLEDLCQGHEKMIGLLRHAIEEIEAPKILVRKICLLSF